MRTLGDRTPGAATAKMGEDSPSPAWNSTTRGSGIGFRAFAKECGQRRYGRSPEQTRQGKLPTDDLFDLRQQSNRQQRMAPEVEEVIVDADVEHSQNAFPDLNQHLSS